MTKANLEELLEQIQELPDLPIVALKINRMLGDPDVDIRKLAETITLDTGLTAKILRLANSSFYALPRKIATIKDAITMLGQRTLKEMLFTVISQNIFSRSYAGYALEKNELWENAVVCGSCAQILTQALKVRDDEVSFTAALLRDLGKLAMEKYMKDMTLDELQTAMASLSSKSFSNLEEELFGVSHTQIGAALARKWLLPDPLVYAMAFHHQPSLMPEDTPIPLKKVISVIHLADCFTAMLGVGVGVDGLMYSVDKKALEYLGLQPAQLQELYALVIDQPDIVKQTLDSLGD